MQTPLSSGVIEHHDERSGGARMAAQVAARDPRGASSAFGVPEKPEMVPPTVEPPTLAAWRRRRRHVHVGLGSTARALPWTFGRGRGRRRRRLPDRARVVGRREPRADVGTGLWALHLGRRGRAHGVEDALHEQHLVGRQRRGLRRLLRLLGHPRATPRPLDLDLGDRQRDQAGRAAGAASTTSTAGWHAINVEVTEFAPAPGSF